MSTISVQDSTGATVNVQAPLAAGQALMVNSDPVVIASDQSALAVTGTFWPATQPVSGTVTVGNASLAVTGSFYQATQPVSIAATVAISAASLPLPTGAALDATLTGGTQKAIARGGAKGTTVAADVTSVATDANTQALHTSVTNFPATQAVSIATMPSTPVTGTFYEAIRLSRLLRRHE